MTLQEIKKAIGLKPYYQNDNGVLYCADCLEVMRRMPDKCVELVLTDPPYGIDFNYYQRGGKAYMAKSMVAMQGNYDVESWNKKKADDKAILSLVRISQDQIIWGGNYFCSLLGNTSCFLVWDKDNTGNFADCELAWTSFTSAVRKFKWRWNGMIQEDMSNKEERKHPTQKPVPLMDWCLRKYATGGGEE